MDTPMLANQQKTDIYQVCAVTGCRLEDLTRKKTDRDGKWVNHIYPTPPLGQDMTQGQFFKRSLTGLNSEFSFS